MVNAVELKNPTQILNSFELKYKLTWVLIALFSFVSVGQEPDAFQQRWEELNQGIKYTQSRNPKGPEKDYIAPQQFNENLHSLQKKPNKSLNDEDIVYSREKRFKEGTDKGVKKHIKSEESKNIKDLSTPDTDAPTIIPPNWNGPDFKFGNGTVFKYIFIIIAILLVVFLIYYFFFKNTGKSDDKIEGIIYDTANDINPETIQKSQLETDLDKAITTENYRAAVRIYYILLLKALIERNWIKWAKRKTNTHYLAEMVTQKEYENFKTAINMYEWSWYGKNKPSKETFDRFSVFYSEFLNRIKDE